MFIEIIGGRPGDVVSFSVVFGDENAEYLPGDYYDETEGDEFPEVGDEPTEDVPADEPTPILGGDAATDAPTDVPADEPAVEPVPAPVVDVPAPVDAPVATPSPAVVITPAAPVA